MRPEPELHGGLTRRIIGVFYQVYHELGYGFLESVYENAMIVALRQEGLSVEQQPRSVIHFRGQPVGVFRSDLLVEHVVPVEIKAGAQLDPSSEAQIINFLSASSFEVSLRLYFGPKPAIKRFIFSRNTKSDRSLRGHPRPSASPASDDEMADADEPQ